MGKQKSIQQLANEFIANKTEYNFENIVKRLTPGIRKHLSKYTNDYDKIELIMGDAFIKIWTKIELYNSKWNFSTWAYSVARNAMITYIQNENKQKSKSLEDLNLKENLDISTNYFETEYNDKYNYDNVLKTLYDASLSIIDNLKEPTKSIIKDLKINNLKNKDLSLAYNKRSCNISIVVKKGLNKINDELKKQYPIEYNLYLKYTQNSDINFLK